jgi:hypothetical protein
MLLSAEKMVEYDKGVFGLGDASVYALREAYSTRPLVQLVHNELTAMTLTVGEARQLANALLSLAETVEPS